MDQTFQMTVTVTLKDRGRKPSAGDAEALVYSALTMAYESYKPTDSEPDVMGWSVNDVIAIGNLGL